MLKQSFLTVCVAFLLASCKPEADVTGIYRGLLDTPGGHIAFPITITRMGDSLRSYVTNGADTTRATSVLATNDSLFINFGYYDSHIKAKRISSGNLSGLWYKRVAGGTYDTLSFSGQKGVPFRYQSQPFSQKSFQGKWQTTFTESDGSTFPATGVFAYDQNGFHGTFLTETGDYRFLEGAATDSSFILSTFDAAHTYLFKGHLIDSVTIRGDFWSKAGYHATFTAHKGDNTLRDPFQIDILNSPQARLTFAFPDEKGNITTINDPQYRDKPILLYLFGSWCPNCADESHMLKELYKQYYRNSDLQIVGLAFEYSGNFQSDAGMVIRYKKRFRIPWQTLIAGISDKDNAASKLPFVKKITSFPTTFFADRNHIIRAVHVGFNGPGTGKYYRDEVNGFKKHIDAILKK